MGRHLLVAGAVRDVQRALGNALLVADGRIVAVGERERLRAEGVTEIRYPGATIIPGLRDAHIHPVGYTAVLQQPSLQSATDFSNLADIVAEALRTRDSATAVTALRLDDERLAEQRLPDRHLLDAISADRPILLMRYCGHVAVANTAALQLAGIDAATKDPIGGVIDRDERGVPTGVLRETAFEPVTAALRPLAPPITPGNVHEALTSLASTGLTSVGAMAATDAGLWGGAASELDVLLEAASATPIGLEVFVIAPNPASLQSAADKVERCGPRVRFAGVKMFSDGSLGGHTAAMYEPFSDRPETNGTDRLDPDWAKTMARHALDLGGRVAIHAIGDRANGNVLDLMEDLTHAGIDPTRLRVEHASVLTPGDIHRFGRLGVTASVQPAFIASETGWLGKRLGPERLRRTYAFRSLIDAGTPLAGGSDCPVEPPHPLHGMAVARDRLGMGMVVEENLSPEEALALFTTGAATAIGQRAALEPGAPADLTVLDVDPVAATPEELRRARVVATWVNGAPAEVPVETVTWPS